MTILRLWIILFSLIAAGPGLATTYINPWAVAVELHCRRGEKLGDVIEKLRTIAAEAPNSPGSVYFRNAIIHISNEASLICVKADLEYKGRIGPVLYALLSDHGLGFTISDIGRIEGYEISITQVNPVENFTVITDVPPEWVRLIEEDGSRAFMERHLRIPAALVADAAFSRQGIAMIYARGNLRACQSLWVYANSHCKVPVDSKTNDTKSQK